MASSKINRQVFAITADALFCYHTSMSKRSNLRDVLNNLYRDLLVRKSRSQAFWILGAFIVTFAVARTVVHLFPSLFLQVGGTHIHHFTYGFVLLAVTGFIAITRDGPSPRIIALIYGIGLGLAVDEAGMWLQLSDHYYNRESYDAIILVSAVLINITYFSEYWLALVLAITRWGRDLLRAKK